MDYQSKLRELLQSDERIIVMTAENRAAIRQLPEEIGHRFLDTGITEQTMVGMAAGLALRGRVPVIHALAAFLTMRAFEFIRTDVGISGLPVKLVGGVPGVLSEANGPTHQAIEDVALMRGIPGMGVFSPADIEDLVLGLPAILAHPGPFYIRYSDRPSVLRHSDRFAIGKAEVVTEGEDVGILVHGALFREACEAAALLNARGYSARLVNLRTLSPVDAGEIVETARRTRVLVTIEDHFETGGLFSIASEILVRRQVPVNLLAVAFPHRWFRPAMLRDVLRVEGLDGEHLAHRMLDVLQRSKAA